MNVRPLPILILILFTVIFHSCEKAERVDPAIRTNEAQNIGTTQATIIGDLQDLGARTNWDFGFVWFDQPGTNINSGTPIYLGNRSELGVYSSLLENLSPGTTYYYKSFVADPGFTRIYYGGEMDFTTLP
jgi:hypothetical protein